MPPAWMVSWLFPFLVAFLVGAAALMVGLWWGERGRRIAAENIQLYGQPRARPARLIPQPMDPEERARSYGHSPETIAKGVKHLQDMAKAEGRNLSHEDAEAQVLYLLHPDTMAEGQTL